MAGRYRILEHPSDLGLEAIGADRPELWDAAVRGLAAVVVGEPLPAPVDSRPIRLEETTDEARLVELLDACLFALDAADWLPVGARLDPDGAGALVGRPLDADLRGRGAHVKAVTWHTLSVAPVAGGLRAVVFLDV